MKFSQILLLSAALAAPAALADVPQKASLNKYSRLWTDSPFTAKPPPPDTAPEENPLDDYVLLGVSPIGQDSYRVTILNKTNPEERITIEPGDEDFKVLSVTRRRGDPLGTVVRLSTGRVEGDVSFDTNLLTLTPPPAAPQQQPQQQIQPQVQPGQQPVPGQPAQQQAQVRQRVVPPPAGGAAAGQRQPTQRGNAETQGRRDRGDRGRGRGR